MKSQKIALIDYGAGNLGSVKNAFAYLGVNIVLESSPHKLGEYDKVVLPGVGAFGDVVGLVRKSGFDSAIAEFAKSGKYLLGICLGMQLLFEKSYEFGEHRGLGLLQGEIVKFGEHLRSPHIGWNQNFFATNLSQSSLEGLEILQDCLEKSNHPLLANIPNGAYLYFVHSYYASNVDFKQVLAICKYSEASKKCHIDFGGKHSDNAVWFPSIVGKDNVLGMQPHPEKSHAIGLQILQNFLAL